ncbi:MAG: hypothetical protein L0Y50_13690 [Beijerinckiaceae bacterium]|nr:hypothetical protein [Beijerinckiaceae bacterium]
MSRRKTGFHFCWTRSSEVSARLVIVHAISPAAQSFYLHHGFTRLPVETPALALDLVKLQKPTKQASGQDLWTASLVKGSLTASRLSQGMSEPRPLVSAAASL